MSLDTLRDEPEAGPTKVLFILLHGVGSSASNIFGLAPSLRAAFPQAAIVAPEGTAPFDPDPSRRQWFSIMGVTEDNRPERVEAAIPAMSDIIDQEMERAGVSAENTFLIGFSQGTIMSLHLAASGKTLGGVVGLSGRLSSPIASRSNWPPVVLVNGDVDPIFPPHVTQNTVNWLKAAGCDVSSTMVAGLAHEITSDVVDVLIENLQGMVKA